MKNILLATAALLFVACNSGNPMLETEFKSPPPSVQTSVYWYWISGEITKQGVVADLESMKQIGINRAFIGNIGLKPIPGGHDVKLFSDEWWDILHTALKTASELDIEIGIFNAPGWSQSGGPWIQPNEAMRYIASSELRVKGPSIVSQQLEKPVDEFEDLKVIAYPVPEEYDLRLDAGNAAVKASPWIKNPKGLIDGSNAGTVELSAGQQTVVDITADGEFTARSLTIQTAHLPTLAEAQFQAKEGDQYVTVADFGIDRTNANLYVGFIPYAPITVSIPATTAKEFRLVLTGRVPGSAITGIEVSASPRIESYAEKSLAKMCQTPLPYWDFYMWRDQPEALDAGMYIDPAKVLDISANMDSEGRLNWEVPEGRWIVLRTGMTPTGVMNAPAPPEGTGLEVDKMSKQHVEKHFDSYIGEILRRIPAQDRRTFKVVVQDSYETGGQNVTDGFLDIFQRQYGYDPTPYLPALNGKVVGNERESDRFLWDMRRLVADKVAYDFVGGFREVCHKHGLGMWLENYGHWGFPGEFLMYGGQSDEIGGEYWSVGELGDIENRAATSCGHIYGKTLISAESNTCGGPAYMRSPAEMKQRTDRFFAEGINNTLLHVYVAQTEEDKYPGTNAWFGNEFDRKNTWFSQLDEFILYLKRCNYMLRQGLNVADVAYFIGEDAPKMTGVQDPALPVGYQFDYINAEVLERDAVVKNGLITLPHGTSYRVLVLPKQETMRPELLDKIRQLIREGAIVLGPAPKRSPSLENQPQADARVESLAAELWAGIGESGYAKVGKGMVFSGVELPEVFETIGCRPDCRLPEGAPIHYGHRQMKGCDIYFVSNQSEQVQKAQIGFRVEGLQPELWDPVTGSTRKLPAFTSQAGETTVGIELDAFQSAFIVFRSKGKPDPEARNYPAAASTHEITSPWEVEFNGKFRNPAPLHLPQLIDLSQSADPEVRHFSGTVIYRNAFDVEGAPEGVVLSIGNVKEMAKVYVNDRYAGCLWTKPYQLDISALVQNGENRLRIELVNTWVNRLVGDLNLPEAERQTRVVVNPYQADSPVPAYGILGPVEIRYVNY